MRAFRGLRRSAVWAWTRTRRDGAGLPSGAVFLLRPTVAGGAIRQAPGSIAGILLVPKPLPLGVPTARAERSRAASPPGLPSPRECCPAPLAGLGWLARRA